MIAKHQACLLLGSNIEPELNIPRAVALLHKKLTVLKWSSVWQSASVECCYPDYLNMAVLVSTRFQAGELKLRVLRPMEARLGRLRTEDPNASRTIDIDIVLFDGETLDADLWEYAHRAVPVAELFPGLVSPDGELLRDVAVELSAITPIQHREDILINPG